MPHRLEDRPDSPIMFDAREEEFAALHEITKSPEWLWLVCMQGRPGLTSFLSEVENTDFIPGTPLNDYFQLYIVDWPEERTIRFVVIGVPASYRSRAEFFAQKHGLRIANGVPTMFVGDIKNPKFFPANHDYVFTLENVPGHSVYKNDWATIKKLLSQDKEHSETQPDIQVIPISEQTPDEKPTEP
jgi:hypothetical protein